jgi:phage terminase small subunit
VPVLKNAKHERFAQGLAAGMSQADAYQDAGYKLHRGNASTLAQDKNIIERVAELLERRDNIETRATERAISKLAVTKEAILSELARIGFADIRKAVDWRGNLTRESDNPDGGDVLVIREIVNQHVRLIDSDKIDDDTAAAISEVRQSPTGGLSIKFHDKQAALVNLGKHLGMFIERKEVGQPGDFDRMSDDELRAELRSKLGEIVAGGTSGADAEGEGTKRSRDPSKLN